MAKYHRPCPAVTEALTRATLVRVLKSNHRRDGREAGRRFGLDAAWSISMVGAVE